MVKAAKVPERGGRAPGLARDQIVLKALELLEDVGYEGLTLRGLAGRLGVKAAALYWHFENKQDLIDAMARHILTTQYMAAFGGFDGQPSWRELLTATANANYRALRSHRDGAQLIAHANMAQTDMMEGLERLLQALMKQGFSDKLALSALFTLVRFTLGCVFEEQADPHRHGTARHPEALPPTVRRVASRSKLSMEAHFNTCVQIILDGFAQQLDARSRHS